MDYSGGGTADSWLCAVKAFLKDSSLFVLFSFVLFCFFVFIDAGLSDVQMIYLPAGVRHLEQGK